MTGRAARIRRRLGRALARLVLAALSLGMAAPFAWMALTAIRSDDDYRLAPGRIRVDWPSPPGRVVLERAFARDADFAEIPLFGNGPALDLSGAAGEAIVPFRFDPPLPAARLSDVSVWLVGDGSGAEVRFRLEGTAGAWVSDRPIRTLFRRRVRVDLAEDFRPVGLAARRAARLVPEAGAPGALAPGAIRLLEVRVRPVSRLGALAARVSENIGRALDRMPFGRQYVNSLVVSCGATFFQVLTSALAGFAFARLRFRGRDGLFLGYLATLMVPFHVTMIPAFLLVKWLGWFDTYWALVLPASFSAYGTFMLRQFFLAIPRDLEDAARIDGCGAFGIWRHVALPLARPALATLAIFTFLSTWQAFLWPLLVTQRDEMLTLPVGLRKLEDIYGGPNAPLTMAASLVVMVPALVMFAMNQRFYAKGIAAGAIKE